MGVSKLIPATAKPDEKVIENLESALKLAREGKLRETVVIGNYTGGGYFYNHSFEDGPLLLGFLYMTMSNIARNMDDNAEIPF